MASANDNERSKLATAGLALVAALSLAAWLLGFFEYRDAVSDDPQVTDILNAMEHSEKADRKLLKKNYLQLNPEQRQEFHMRKMLLDMPKQEQQLNDFFSQPEAEQWQQIDREIDTKKAAKQAGGPVKGKSAGGTTNPQQIMSMKKEWTANASPELRSMVERRIRMMQERREQRGL